MRDNDFDQHRCAPTKALNKQKSLLTEKYLGKSFNQSIESKDFDGAHQTIKKALSLNYPPTLINSWRDRLDHLEYTHRHPLDSLAESSTSNINYSCQLAPHLRKTFQANIKKYFDEKGIGSDSIQKITDFVFNNLDKNSGKILIPDITAHQPILNLISYSVQQYMNESPDVLRAIERGDAISAMDHFLRYGFLEIVNGRRSSSIYLSYDKINYTGKIVYIIDDYHQLTKAEIDQLYSLQHGVFSPDIFSINDSSVHINGGEVIEAEQYFYQNISEVHNLCILLKNRSITKLAIKWLIDIKLKDRTAVFGYSNNEGIFHPNIELSVANLLISEVTNGCIIVNAIEVLSVLSDLKCYRTSYGFYHALVAKLYFSGVNFLLKREVLSRSKKTHKNTSIQVRNDVLWSPFYWHISDSSSNKALLIKIRQDLIETWSSYLHSKSGPLTTNTFNSCLYVDSKENIVTLNQAHTNKIAILIPFKDKIYLLENCVESLMNKKEDIDFTIYAINNDSSEPDTFDKLSAIKEKYPGQFVVIDSPGEFNYSKINNDAVHHVEEDYLLFLNNDILFETEWTLTTLLKTHYFNNAIITGARLLYPSGNLQHNGLATTNLKHIAVTSPFCGTKLGFNNSQTFEDIDSHPWDRTHECSAVTAACMLINKSDFSDIGGFDEQLKVAYNDIDLCFRARKKYPFRPIICCNESKIIHLESESRGLDVDKQRSARLNKERYLLVNRHQALFDAHDTFIGIDTTSNDIYKNAKNILDRQHNVDINPIKTDISLETLYSNSLHFECRRDFACVFIHYDKDALVSEECLHHIKMLGVYCDIYFVSSSEKLASKPEELEKVFPFCKQVLIRENSGYDFGCWSHVIRENYDELCSYKGVLLCNDSNWGPMNDFSDTFEKINQNYSDFDFFGLTASITPSWHLQSFFILYSKRVFSSSYFKQHWFDIGVFRSKYNIIINYEVNWSGRLMRLGFTGMSLYGENLSLAENHTHVHWDSLLKSNYPYLKKELLRDNPLMVDLQGLPEIINTYSENWSYHILDYLKRHGKAFSDIAQSLKT